MTFSIVACDLDEGAWGVAVASKFPAVGAVVPWAQAGVGAVATQSFANTSFGPRGLALLGTGLSAQETLVRLLEDDTDKELRQVGLVDAKGGSATFSGSGCFAWAGGVSGKGYAIQGNILASGKVIPAMDKAFLKTKGSLPMRLHAALLAVTAPAVTSAAVNLRRSMLPNPRPGMAVTWTAGWTTAWTIMKIPSRGLASCSKCTTCILAKARSRIV
jgi:uncharacterized Ntn-hydrolase superfamily protein